MPPLSEIIHDVDQASYKLDTSGVAGLLGGDNAVDALETIHLYQGRRWAGWYNYPGTVTVAKRFGQMASSRLWDSIFPGPNECPATTFKLAGKVGPDYSGSFSGTKLRTGYLGYLITRESLRNGFPSKPFSLVKKDGSEGRKTGSSATVVVISLPPRERITSGTEQKHEFILASPNSKFNPPVALLSIFPSLVSVLACALCFMGHDPTCASLILFGIVSSGFSSLVLGTATLGIHVPVPSTASPPGDGLMFPEDGSMIVLKGKEVDVNVVTKGEFKLDYPKGILFHPNFHAIGIISIFLCVQFLAQLLLIPRCTLFGQIVFLVSFVASGVYHLYVASHERENVHWNILSRLLSAQMEKWTLGTRTQMAVFTCLVLGDDHQFPMKSNPNTVLTRIIPNDTAAWRYWRMKVVKELERFWDSAASHPYIPTIEVDPGSEEADEHSRLSDDDKKLLGDLIDDAWCVFKKYGEWRENETKIWQEQGHGTEENSGAHLLSEGNIV